MIADKIKNARKKIQNRGNEEAEIIEVKDANHITVKFKDGTIVKDRNNESVYV